MFFGTNQDQGQHYNRRVVLETIRLYGSVSRADISRLAGLSYQSVSNMADTLVTAGLLVEERRRDGRRGQPPVNLSINPQGGFSVGVTFDQRRLVASLVDLAGVMRKSDEVEVDGASPALVLPQIKAVVCRLRRAARVPAKRIYGVGLVMPGLSRDGTLIGLEPGTTHRWLPQWTDVKVIAELERLLQLPVYTDNDAAAAAIGERLYGHGRSFQNFILIYLSAGVGAGIIVGGQPYRSRSGRSGELGHMVVVAGGRSCACGNRGCLERYASLSAAQSALTGRPEGSDPVDPDEIAAAVQRGEPRMLTWLHEAAWGLSAAITSCENLLDPEATLIGGTLPDVVLDALIGQMTPLPRSVSSCRASDAPRLIRAPVGLAAAALGAASLPVFESTAADLSLLLNRSV